MPVLIILGLILVLFLVLVIVLVIGAIIALLGGVILTVLGIAAIMGVAYLMGCFFEWFYHVALVPSYSYVRQKAIGMSAKRKMLRKVAETVRAKAVSQSEKTPIISPYQWKE